MIKKTSLFIFFTQIIFSFYANAQTKTEIKQYLISIIKLGGSVITNKEKKFGSTRYDTIITICKEISEFLSKHPHHRIIVVTGGGGLAHAIAKEYDLKTKLDSENMDDIWKCHDSVKELNSLIVEMLNLSGVPAFPIHPSSCTVCCNKKIKTMDIDIISQLLDNNVVPVLHGDIVLDTKQCMCILSGDQIVAYLGTTLCVDRIGLASIEDGILDETGTVIPEINQKNFDLVKKHIGGSSCKSDVTGGMLKKVEELLGAQKPKLSCIFNGAKKGCVTQFLMGEPIGTTIVNTVSTYS